MSIVKSEKKDKPDTPGKTEKPTIDQKTLEEMKKNIPSTLETLFDLPEGEGKNVFDLLTVQIGGQNKDVYASMERTELTTEEIPLFAQLIQLAEHGINMPECGLDFTIPAVGERVVHELRMRRSKNRESSHEFERIMSGLERAWVEGLRRKEKEQNKFVGTGS